MIISRQLKTGMTLVRGKESFKIKELIRTGRSCTAVVNGKNGKEERLSITDMWNQKISIFNPDKKIMKVEKAEKPAKVEKTKKMIPVVSLRKEESQRGKGITTTYFKKDGSVFSSSWKRNN
jgi:hypothetical protein